MFGDAVIKNKSGDKILMIIHDCNIDEVKESLKNFANEHTNGYKLEQLLEYLELEGEYEAICWDPNFKEINMPI